MQAAALVEEYVRENNGGSLENVPAEVLYDEKNIRRRIYDALNVLMAINVIGKVKTTGRISPSPLFACFSCDGSVRHQRTLHPRAGDLGSRLFACGVVCVCVPSRDVCVRVRVCVCKRCMVAGR